MECGDTYPYLARSGVPSGNNSASNTVRRVLYPSRSVAGYLNGLTEQPESSIFLDYGAGSLSLAAVLSYFATLVGMSMLLLHCSSLSIHSVTMSDMPRREDWK